ncbi:MBL fold metallo-hydrolase, partial [Dubosiella newyorkensis]
IGNDVFTGDVLFQGSVGRVDLPSGSEKDMIESIHYLKTLDPDLRVYPGHGPSTSIGQEMRWNPYFRY